VDGSNSAQAQAGLGGPEEPQPEGEGLAGGAHAGRGVAGGDEGAVLVATTGPTAGDRTPGDPVAGAASDELGESKTASM